MPLQSSDCGRVVENIKMRVLSITILASLFLLSKTQNVEIRCDFIVLFEYTCQAHNFIVSRNNTRNIVIIGNHLPNRTNADVVNVQTFDQPLPFVIAEFFTIFPNMNEYSIFGGVHTIQEGAFRQAHNLETLLISRSQLRTVQANAMEGASKLMSFAISECFELERIDQNAFFGLTNLVQVTIMSSLRSLPENIFSSLSELRRVSISSQIQSLPGKLFDNNLQLEDIVFLFNEVNAVDRSLVDNFGNMPNLYRLLFVGNVCGNIDSEPFNIDAVHSALEQCYRNFEKRRSLSFELQGSLVIRDENGNVLLEVYD